MKIKINILKKYCLLFLVFIFLFLRFYNLPKVFNFSMDQGKTLLTIYQLWQDKKFTLIGPESSIKTNMGRTFFHGPWIYYFLLPVMLIANWNPFTGAYLFIGLNLLALIILFKAIKQGFGFRTALISSFLFTFTPNVVRFSQFFWNPNFLPLVSSLIIFLGVKIKKKQTLYSFSCLV